MSEVLYRPVTMVKGVGEELAGELAGLGICTVKDMLEYFPYRYEDYRIRDLSEVADGDKITVKGVVYGAPNLRFFSKNKSRLAVKVMVDRVMVTAVWFNRAFIKQQLTPGREVLLTGKWDRARLHISVQEHHIGESAKQELEQTIQPVYSGAGGLTSKRIRKLIVQAFKQYGNEIVEIIPATLVAKYKLMPRRQALMEIHFPDGTDSGRLARRRLAFEELFLFQLKLQIYRHIQRQEKHGIAFAFSMQEINQYISALPFSFTTAQKRVVDEILADMRSLQAMNRLLQGDVGSGKTVVASVALFAAVRAGYQAAMMVPTEILAEQHLKSLRELLTPQGMEVALLTGSMTARQRRDVLAQLQMGLVDVVVGTHALIQDNVFFKKLGLIITDEQHRFGVEQRRILREKGMDPDVLYMTATPIPRTLAITAFGDLDVSTIDELPAGRKPVETHWARHNMFERVLRFVEQELAKGRQAYVICPLIEESEKLDLQNAMDVHAQLTHFFKQYRVGLMHSRLSSAEKEDVMNQFGSNDIHVLVSTTVVEVGVNVPNATIMVIYDAERFGLSQLHQLRGRVGRGEHQAYCILIADPKTEVGKERMKVMTETNDGFEVSRRDLELRGPGDFFGTKQSGLPDFKIADMIQDYKALEVARTEATNLVGDPHFWENPEYGPLREYLKSQGILQGKILD